MNKISIRIALATCLVMTFVAVASLSAQSTGKADKEDAAAGGAEIAPQQAEQYKMMRMYEDVEIMRGLLVGRLDKMLLFPNQVKISDVGGKSRRIRGLAFDNHGGLLAEYLGNKFYYLPGNTVKPENMFGIRSEVRAEGVYLADRGVVFNVTLTSPVAGTSIKQCAVCHDTTSLSKLQFTPQRLAAADRFHPHPTTFSTCTTCHGQSIGKRIIGALPRTPKPKSAWEQARQRLRGEKENAGDKPKQKPAALELTVCGPGTVTETILQLMAQHGHNFSQLSSNEKLTVAVTIRPGSRSRKTGGASGSMSPMGMDSEGGLEGAGLSAPAGLSPNPSAQSGSGGFEIGGADAGGGFGHISPNPRPKGRKSGSVGGGGDNFSGGTAGSIPGAGNDAPGAGSSRAASSARDHELLGDLHMKQGKAKQAAQEYSKALNIQAKEVRNILSKFADASDLDVRKLLVPITLKSRGLQSKWIQALVAAGELETAQKNLLKMLDEQMANMRAKPKAEINTVKPRPLPARIIVSIPKAALDAAAAGKIGYPAIVSLADIQYIGPNVADELRSSSTKIQYRNKKGVVPGEKTAE